MTGFYGKTYRYKNGLISVRRYMNCKDVYMIGIMTDGKYERMKSTPLFGNAKEAQKSLDEYARGAGLPEVL